MIGVTAIAAARDLVHHKVAAPVGVVPAKREIAGGARRCRRDTVGQRRGLSLGVPSPDGRPRFVLEVKPSTRQLVVGPKEALDVVRLAGTRISHAGTVHPQLADGLDVEVQIRAHADPVPARARMDGDELVIEPEVPLSGVATGQSAVLYLGTRVLGQCTIDRTVAADVVAA